MPIAFSSACINPLASIRGSPDSIITAETLKGQKKTIEQLHKLNEKGKVSIKLKEVHAPNSGNYSGLRMTYEILERVDNLKTQFS